MTASQFLAYVRDRLGAGFEQVAQVAGPPLQGTVSNLPVPFRARMTWAVATVIGVYVWSAHLLANEQSAEVWRSLQISLSFMVVIAYWRRAIACFRVVGTWPDRTQLISLGIVMSWMSVLCNGVWGMFWRLSGQPAWMVNNDLYQSWVMFNCIAAGLHIAAPNILGPGVPKIERARLASAFALALVLIAVLSLTRPDLSGVSEAIRPIFETTFRRDRNMPPPDFSRTNPFRRYALNV